MDCALMCAARDTFIVTPRHTKGVLWMTKGSINVVAASCLQSLVEHSSSRC